jgi:hypothetical protein
MTFSHLRLAKPETIRLMTSPDRVIRQLEIINEITDLAKVLGIELWLEGGWAMDFYLGEVTREHDDIDWFMWAEDALSLTTCLTGRGYVQLTGPPVEQQIDFARDGIEVSFKLVIEDENGSVVVAGGPWKGEAWPQGILDGPEGRIGAVRSRVIDPNAQIEMKRMMPIWVPGRPRRPKDVSDIAKLEDELRRRKDATL